MLERTYRNGSPNPRGNPESLTPATAGNALGLKHAVYSPRMREDRAREVADTIMAAPWVSEVDELGAVEIGRLWALVEALDGALEKGTDRQLQGPHPPGVP